MKTMLYLLSENPEGDRSTVPIQPEDCLFAGSGSGCHVKLSGDNIAAIHCVFWMDLDGSVHVQDRGKTNKTTLNGQPFDVAVFSEGDEILIGNCRLSISTAATAEPEVAVPVETTNWENHDLLSPANEVQDCPPETVVELDTPNEVDAPTISSALPALDEGWHFEEDEEEDTLISFENESNFHENEMLRMEVEQLRSELAQRDAQSPLNNGSQENDEALSPQATERLVLRLEELLDELQSSDDRIHKLEELLRLSDSATQAEQQERKQLESWVAGIEDRVCQKEAESVAELEHANQQLQIANTRIRDLETRLEKVINSGNHQDTTAVKEFQQQLERAQTQYQQVMDENAQLKSQLEEQRAPGRSQAEFEALEEKLMQLEVAKSRERAEMARQRAEMERMVHQLESNSKSQIKLQDADTRVRAMQLHLRELHDQEQQEKKERSLGTRISQLFSRTKLNK